MGLFPQVLKRTIPLNSFPENKTFSGDTLRLLAVMVEFQEDNDNTTVGNGKFNSIYSKDYGTSIIDPLPHDKNYFSKHLDFAANYFKKVSNNRLNISYHILDNVITLSKIMREYSPPIKSTNFSSMGEMFEEVWQKADVQNPGFNFSEFDAFIIFHAGVGRDVSLPSSLGNERDIPSIYMGINTLKNIFGSSYNGVLVSNGNFFISNSLILPQTQNREVSTFGGTVLFELTINGLLCSAIGSHLGLPDLFDTKTGLSAIGRFGLMDGQSIFAFLGCFPPEPSPWEKMKLGWINPIEISKTSLINLTTPVASLFSDTTVVKIPINQNEYFLIENRQRDALSNGANIRIYNNGNLYTKNFQSDTSGFFSYDISALEGVIVDVDEFDWAIPGNGILIWHIDEGVINRTIADNKVNADKKRRGVDLEEADGVQEIGEEFQTIFGDILVGEGTKFDFWFAGNDARLYTGVFDYNSRPNSRSNDGANSLISISNFSASGNRMSFTVTIGDSLIKPLFSITTNSNDIKLQTIEFNNNSIIAVNSENDLRIYNASGELQNNVFQFSKKQPAALSLSNGYFVYGVFDSLLSYYHSDISNSFSGNINVGKKISTQPVIIKSLTEVITILVGTDDGYLVKYQIDGNINSTPQFISSELIASNNKIEELFIDENYSAFLLKEGNSFLFKSSRNENISLGNNIIKLVVGKINSIDYMQVALFNDNGFKIFKNGTLINSFIINSPYLVQDFILSDIKNNGNNYILFTAGESLYAYSINGVLAENFPVNFENELTKFIASADFINNKDSEIFILDKSGNLYSIGGIRGEIVSLFPLSIGTKAVTNPSFFRNNGKLSILSACEGIVKAFQIGADEGLVNWSGTYVNYQNTNVVVAAQSINMVSNFFPENKVYNYPNPVYGGETKIRFYVSEDSDVNVKIFDLAGDFVAELSGRGSGGFENEITWNVNNIQSGIYLAKVEVKGSIKGTASKIIKIAVVK